jgi:zinc protease
MKTLQIEIGERVLANGLTLLAVRNPGTATFAAGVSLDVDLRDERPGEEGLANLVGDCLDEGSKKRSGVELAEQLDRLGAQLEPSASGASLHCPAEVAGKTVRLLAEVVFEPTFPAREVKRVQQELIAEIKADEDDPRTVAALRFRKKVYGRHPYGRPARGTVRSVTGFVPAQLRAFHRRNFAGAGGYVAAAGPDEPEATLDLLAGVFRGVRAERAPRPAMPSIGWPQKTIDEHVSMRREQVHVFVGHPGIRRVDPDYHALLVMDHVLGTGPGFTSRIARLLRDEMGLCYSVDASITRSAREEPGTFTAYIGTSPQHRQRAIDGFLAEMRRIREVAPTAQEIADVQEYLTGSFVWQLERNAGLASYAIRTKRFGLGFDYLARYPDLIRVVTPEEVRRVAAAHLDPDRVAIFSAGAG